MKKSLFISILLCANLLRISASEPFVSRVFPASSVRAVEAVTSGGSITVSGDADSEAVVEVYVSRDKWSAEKIKQTFEENYTLDIELKGGKLHVEARSKSRISNWNQQGLNISFKITVPRQANSNLRTSGGSIHISNMSGEQDFTTSGGSLKVENVSGKINGRTSGGSITVANSSDVIELKTSGGSISAKDCNGKIKLSTSGGSLNLSNLSGDIDASTSGGSVTAKNIHGALKTGTSGGSVRLEGISGSVEARSSGGAMNVTMESVSDYVRLTNSGNTSLTLPSGKGYQLNVKGNKVETSGLADFRGNMTGSSIDGATGSGGPEISIKTSQRARLTFL